MTVSKFIKHTECSITHISVHERVYNIIMTAAYTVHSVEEDAYIDTYSLCLGTGVSVSCLHISFDLLELITQK